MVRAGTLNLLYRHGPIGCLILHGYISAHTDMYRTRKSKWFSWLPIEMGGGGGGACKLWRSCTGRWEGQGEHWKTMLTKIICNLRELGILSYSDFFFLKITVPVLMNASVT